MHCEACGTEWARTVLGDVCEDCGRPGEVGFPSQYSDLTARWRPEPETGLTDGHGAV